MKKIILVFFFLSNALFAQVGYVEISNPVYKFLDRMESNHVISGYNSFEIPKTRSEITDNLKKIVKVKSSLNSIDRLTLNDFLFEFEFDMKMSTDSYYALFNNKNDDSLINQKEKFLYFYTDSSRFNAFINFVGSAEALYSNDKMTSQNMSASLVTFGGELRGTVLNHFGFFARATNGIQFGDKELASVKSNLKYNYKIHSNNDSSNYFDETIGYLSAEYSFINFKIGRDRVNLGYGPSKIIMDNYFPTMDYLSMHINYSIFSFSFLHGKLFGKSRIIYDDIQGGQRIINDKYIAYHRLGLNFSSHFNFGIGETIIYANRNLDLSYLNPLNFYKSAEHANQDRDNSMMFFDFRNISVKGLTIYGMFLIDDIDFSKLSTDWYGNKFAYNFGLTYEILPEFFPLTVGFQYLRIDPYVYSHRFEDNSYTSYDIGVGANLQPNSESFMFSVRFKPHYRIELEASYKNVSHGVNLVSDEGDVLVNYGGDILVGHRTFDSPNVKFLEGVREESNYFTFSGKYEPIKNYYLTLKANYINIRKANLDKKDLIILNLILSARI